MPVKRLYLFTMSSIKLVLDSCTNPRLLNVPRKASSAAAEVAAGVAGAGEPDNGVDSAGAVSGGGGGRDVGSGDAGELDVGAGGGKGAGGGRGVGGAGGPATGVNWIAVECCVLPPLLRTANVHIDATPVFLAKAVHAHTIPRQLQTAIAVSKSA